MPSRPSLRHIMAARGFESTIHLNVTESFSSSRLSMLEVSILTVGGSVDQKVGMRYDDLAIFGSFLTSTSFLGHL